MMWENPILNLLMMCFFLYLKMKQRLALQDLDGTDAESEYNSCVENLELMLSGWPYKRKASVTIDLYEKKTKSGISYVEQHIRYQRFINFETLRLETRVCMELVHNSAVTSSRTSCMNNKRFWKNKIVIIKPSVDLKMEYLWKTSQKPEKLIFFNTNSFDLDEKHTFPPVFLPLHYTRKVPKDKDEEKRILNLIF